MNHAWDTGESNPCHFEKTVIHLFTVNSFVPPTPPERIWRVPLKKKVLLVLTDLQDTTSNKLIKIIINYNTKTL